MYLISEICHFCLYACVELTLIYTVLINDIFAQLSACQMMEYHTLLTGVDDSAVVKFFKLVNKLCLFCQGGKLLAVTPEETPAFAFTEPQPLA